MKMKGDLEPIYEKLTSRTGNVRWEKLEHMTGAEKAEER